MFNFKGCNCVACRQPLKPEDDIVVCPDCGAPYHRACYEKLGRCQFEAQHGPDFEWQPSPEERPAPEPEPLSPVYTDWSKLTPYEPAKEQYAYADTYREDGALRPSGDYGFLLPYIGSYLETERYMGPLTTLGLVTVDGRLVTPPVYAEIEMARDWLTNAYAPFLLLYRGEVTARHENEWGSWAEGDFNLTVASPDGSWVRELPPCYGGGCLLSGDRLALALTDGSVLILNPDGSTAMTFPASALEPYLGEGFTWQWDGGPSLDWVDDVGRVWKYDENDP